MRFADYFRIAISNLWKRKLRTALTIFAVVIGATLVGLMVSLGVGLQNYVAGQLTALSVPDVIGVEPETNMGLASVMLGATGLGAPQEVEEGQAYPYLDIGTLTGEDVERIRAVEHVDAPKKRWAGPSPCACQ
jgi:putative ABC transport system permease protein